MYYYENHMGGVFTSDTWWDLEDLYCEECGDSDSYIGWFETTEEFLEYFADDISIEGSGGYELETLLEDIYSDLDYTVAEKIVRANKTNLYEVDYDQY